MLVLKSVCRNKVDGKEAAGYVAGMSRSFAEVVDNKISKLASECFRLMKKRIKQFRNLNSIDEERLPVFFSVSTGKHLFELSPMARESLRTGNTVVEGFGSGWRAAGGAMAVALVVASFGEERRRFEYRVTEKSLMDRLTTDIRGACQNIPNRCRVLTVHGSMDEMVPVEDAMEFAKNVPNHKLQIIEGADHEFTSHQDELSSAVLAFVKVDLRGNYMAMPSQSCKPSGHIHSRL
ncbi:putative delta(8)-fatty-acid desaturase-like isoform 1 [Capsicum annuum]|nr:putative delta(8)-fatty-acid desaturase-like isoform 1 [Capsicum annuum]